MNDERKVVALKLIDERIRLIPEYDHLSGGRCIAISLTDTASATGAYVLVRLLRSLGCSLPIELWVPDVVEFHSIITETFADFGVRWHPVSDWGSLNTDARRLYAIIHSRYREVLLLDHAVIPLKNPEYIFDEITFLMTGALFWSGIWSWACELLDILDMPKDCSAKPISNILLIDKAQVWEPLYLAFELLGTHLHKPLVATGADACLASWNRFGQLFATSPRACQVLEARVGRRMRKATCHCDIKGDWLFQERSEIPWRLHGYNPSIMGGILKGKCREYLTDLRGKWFRVFDPSNLHSDLAPKGSRWASRFTADIWWLNIRSFKRVVDPSDYEGQMRDDGERGSLMGSYNNEIIFHDDGTLGESCPPEFACWQIRGNSCTPKLQFLSDIGSVLLELTPGVTVWKGERMERDSINVYNLSKVSSVFPGAREGKPCMSRNGVTYRRQYTEPLYVFNSSTSLADHIISCYSCGGATVLGRQVTFVTPFSEWLARVEQPGLVIAKEFPAGSPFEKVTEAPIDLNTAPEECLRYAISKARWFAARLDEELVPVRPERFCREVRGEKLDFQQFITIAPCSRLVHLAWLPVHWSRLIYLLRRKGFDILAIGAPDQEEYLADICAGSGAFWTVSDSPEWISNVLLSALLFVGSDLDLAQFAGLLQIPTVFVQATQEVRYFWECTDVVGVTPQTDCALCRTRSTLGYAAECSNNCSALHTISPEIVLKKIEELLKVAV